MRGSVALLRSGGLCLLTSLLACSSSRNSGDVALERTNRGIEYFNAGDHIRAVDELSQALVESPSYVLARLTRAKALSELGRHEEAIGDLDVVLRQQPRHVEALANVARCVRLLGDADHAIRLLDRVIELSPAYTWAYNERGMAHWWGRRDPRAARTDFDRAIHLDRSYHWAFGNRATVRLAAGDREGAISDLDECLRLDPNHAWGLRERGRLRTDLGRFDVAIADLERALHLDATDTEAASLLVAARMAWAEASERGDRDDDSLGLWRTALQACKERGDGSAGAIASEAFCRFQIGDIEGARSLLNRAVETDRSGSTALAWRARFHHALGNDLEAIRDVDEYVWKAHDRTSVREANRILSRMQDRLAQGLDARIDATVERIHGVAVTDPYRWLEDSRDDEVASWSSAQDRYARAVLESAPTRRAHTEGFGRVSTGSYPMEPWLVGDRLFYRRWEQGADQAALVMRVGTEGRRRIIVDPNSIGRGGSTSLDRWFPSRDGRWVAYALSEHGSEASTLYVRNVDQGVDLPDRIPRCKWASVAWLPDTSGFYYTRYPEPGSVPEGEEWLHRRVYFHRLGSDASKDPQAFPDRPEDDYPNVEISKDGRFLLVEVWKGWSKSEIYVKDLTAVDAPWKPLVEGIDALFDAYIVDGRLYVYTNEGAPRYRILTADDPMADRSTWTELVPEQPAVLKAFALSRDRLVLEYLERGGSRLRVRGLDGSVRGEVTMTEPGTASGWDVDAGGDRLVLTFESFLRPPRLLQYDLVTQRQSPIEEPSSTFDPADYEVRLVTYPSRDGTDISMFVLNRKDMRPGPERPTILYGYGGFNESKTPFFAPRLLYWLDRGGVFAVPHLRGGGEYGDAWHREGMLDLKQNTFDDFIAAAEWLISQGMASAERLGCWGASNGGLLVAAVVTQRPELFRSAVCEVPLTDMVRYPRFGRERQYVPEYGDPDDPAGFKWLLAYSPYHRIKDGASYPAVLLVAAERDARTDPAHARKFAARLRAAGASDRPILLRTYPLGGHGAGTAAWMLRDREADRYTFLEWQLSGE